MIRATRSYPIATGKDAYAVVEFKLGQRVKAHPATDTFMRGDVYGTVIRLGTRYVTARMDTSGREVRFAPANLIVVKLSDTFYR